MAPPDKNFLGRGAGVEIAWDLETTSEVVESDIEGKPIVNAAGEPFDPPIRLPFSIPILRIMRNGQQVAAYALRPFPAG